MITTLTLNPTLDTTLFVKDFMPDDSNRVLNARKDPGGKGLNVSRILHKLGQKVTTITLLGGHTGDEVDDLLRAEGLFPFTIRIAHDTRNNITITKQASYQQTRFNQNGPQVSRGEWESVLSMIEQLGDNADIFVLSGSLPPGVPRSAYKEIIALLKNINPSLKIILDADDEPLLLGMEEHPFLVKPNLHEAERLLGRELPDEDSWQKALADIRARGVDQVIISLGKDGIIGSNGQETIRVLSPQVQVKSTVGAGDALVAGICYKLQEKSDFADMLSFGVKVSTAKVMQAGTSLSGWDDLKEVPHKPQVIRL